jgi:hypothetical protein
MYMIVHASEQLLSIIIVPLSRQLVIDTLKMKLVLASFDSEIHPSPKKYQTMTAYRIKQCKTCMEIWQHMATCQESGCNE